MLDTIFSWKSIIFSGSEKCFGIREEHPKTYSCAKTLPSQLKAVFICQWKKRMDVDNGVAY